MGWIADYPCMDDFLYPLFATGDLSNNSRYSDPEFDALLDEARTTIDDAERVATYQEAGPGRRGHAGRPLSLATRALPPSA